MALQTDGVPLDVVARRITRVSFDHAISLLIDGGAELTFETQFEVRHPGDSSTLRVVPEAAAEQASQLLVLLLHKGIRAAVFYNDGVLELRVGDVLLYATAHQDYEAWNFAGISGEKVVCLPGGGVSDLGFPRVASYLAPRASPDTTALAPCQTVRNRSSSGAPCARHRSAAGLLSADGAVGPTTKRATARHEPHAVPIWRRDAAASARGVREPAAPSVGLLAGPRSRRRPATASVAL